jgi:hypothetical protein
VTTTPAAVRVDPESRQAPAPSAATEAEWVLHRVRLLLQLRVAWLRSCANDRNGTSTRMGASHTDVDLILNDRDRPELEHAWRQHDVEAQRLVAGLRAMEADAAAQPLPRLGRLQQIFGLTPADVDLLQLCLASAIDPSLSRVWAYLHHHAGRPELNEAMAARTLGYGRMPPWTEDSAIFRWELVHRVSAGAGEPDGLSCDQVVRDWFLDRDALDPALAGVAREVRMRPAIDGWPIDEAIAFIDRAVHDAGGRIRCVVTGPSRSGRRTFAAAVAHHFGMAVLNIDTDAVDASTWRALFVRAQRYAYLYRCVLAWSGDAPFAHAWPTHIPIFPIQFVIGEPGATPVPCGGLIDRTFDLPLPGIAVRQALWTALVPQSREWDPGALKALATRYRAWPGDIAQMSDELVPSVESAALRLRECARGRLGDLAQLLECPFEASDLVLPAASRHAIDDFLFEAAMRAEFWEQPASRRLFPQGRGLLALFSGPPGTGKTMAAQVIAGQLGMDLYRINYASLVSKWVGESAKNTHALLHKAATMDCILLFDEADAMFARRTNEMKDAQDKYANTDASHLMVAIEAYGGMVILASNLKGHIDPAFLRRIRYIIDFPKPDAAQRLELWNRLVTSLAGGNACERLQPQLRQLAADVETTGSQIKFALLGALFAARRDATAITLDHLLHGLNRELTKEGRGLSDRERERIAAHAR